MGRTKSRVWFAAVLACAVLGGGVAAADEHEPDEPVFARRDVWFHAADHRVGNLHGGAFGQRLPSWDTNKPTASQPLGAGAVYAASPSAWLTTLWGITSPHDPRSGPTFAGTHTGDLENMAVELYAYMPTNHFQFPAALSFDFRIDGEQVLFQDETTASWGINAQRLNSEGLYSIKFVLTNLYKAMQEFGMDVADDKVHDVYLNVTTFYLGTESVFVFDSAQAPAGAVFNLLDDARALGKYTTVDVFDPPPPYSAL